MAMRVTINDLMDRLGVGYVLGPYQTHPWSFYDATRGQTCSAEVRMGPDNDEVEAEAQLVFDNPPEGKSPMEQLCTIRATPSSEGQWTLESLRIRGAPYGKDIYDWEGKACVFFSLLVQCLQEEKLPNIEELVEEAFNGKERFRDQAGGGGGKSPKIRPAQLLNMKKGGGGF